MTCREGDADHDPHPTDEEGVDVCDGCGTEYAYAFEDPGYPDFYPKGWGPTDPYIP